MRTVVKRNLGLESRKPSLLDVVTHMNYLCLCVLTLLLSIYFPDAELQFLTLSVITGAKWIVNSSSRRINIVIREEVSENESE